MIVTVPWSEMQGLDRDAGGDSRAGPWPPTSDLLQVTQAQCLSRGETHVVVLCNFINLMKLPNVETLVFWVPASNNFMF